MAKREMGTLWIGGDFTWLEQISLKSFVDKGEDITLFHYGPVGGVPDGVKLVDGREIIDTESFLKYKMKDSYALFADLFRLHMIHKRPGMIWVDTDVYCWQPMRYDFDNVFGKELYGKHRINNAVLGLEAEGDILRAMLDFTEDQYSQPAFLSKKDQEKLQTARDAGDPIHVSEMRWGVWGPLMLSYYVHIFGLLKDAQEVDAFYPVTFPERKKFLRAPRRALQMITENTTALHLWASNKKPMGVRFDGLPPKGSFFEKLCNETGIDPQLAPVSSRGKAAQDVDDEE